MAFAGNVWAQLKNITAGELAKALERDGWTRDTKGGSQYIYRKVASEPRRVSVHFHPGKTYGPATLKGLLDDTGWTDVDLRRLKLIK
jgi:predicted RNA binding protein YcfA (HicA-like mRNA interferase family)